MNLLRKLKDSSSSSPKKTTSMEGRSQPLGPKDVQAFQKALTLYESKDYEKSLAEVEDIIKRRKEKIHGESLCLKGLLLHHLNREPEECSRLMAEGCKADAKSHVAWHMAGIYHKLKHEYAPAYRAYLTSFKLKQDNSNVHQDLAMLAVQQRDYPTLVQVRRQVLGARVGLRMAWTGLVAAQYLNKDFSGVEQTVALYEQIMTVEKASNKTPKTVQSELTDEIETSELLMIRNQAIIAQNQFERAVTDLDKIEPRVRDKLAWLESRALALSHYDKQAAETEYFKLLDRNPENGQYYESLERLVSTDLTALYSKLAERYPKADMPVSRPLLIFKPAELSDYTERLETYLKGKLAREVPSTFMLVKELYTTDEKRKVVTEVVEDRLKLLESSNSSVNTTVFVARHLSYTERQTEAVSLLENVDITTLDEDTRVDVQLAMTELLQRAGAFVKAASIIKQASESIPGDRYLNTKAAEAAFRAGDIDEGYKLAYQFPIWGKHAKNDQEALKHLVSLESVNVLLSMAESHHRRREHGLALKRAKQTIDVFHAYYREQYDFHFYGPRRGTLRTYIKLVEWENELYSHPAYIKAVKIAVNEWVAFARKETDGFTEKEISNAKRRRAHQLENIDIKEDNDPFGIGLLESKTGLQQAFDAYKFVENAKPSDPHTWWMAFRIFLAQEKYVLANQALKKARDFGLSASKLASGGLMARHTLEHDGKAPQVLRNLQLKMLPSIVTAGDLINSDPIEYANTQVKDLLDWIYVRRFMNTIDGVETQVVTRLPELHAFDDVEKAFLELQKAGSSEKFVAAVKEAWPKAEF